MGLRVWNVHDELGIDRIEYYNDEPWNRLATLLDDPTTIPGQAHEDWTKETSEPVPSDGMIFDFKDVTVTEPWKSQGFKEFVSNGRVFLRLYNAKNAAATIEAWCRLSGCSYGRVMNVDILGETTAKESRMDKVIRVKAEELEGTITETHLPGGVYFDVRVADVYNQVVYPEHIKEIEKAILNYHEHTGAVRYRILCGKVPVQKQMIRELAEIAVQLEAMGLEVKIISDIPEVMDKATIWLSIKHGENYNSEQKLRLIEKSTPVNSVGMLTEYVQTRGKDEFGRSGNGKVASCRPALYLGVIRERNGGGKVLFRRYRLFATGKLMGERIQLFTTRLHYGLENDGEAHPGLVSEDIMIPIEDLGVYTDFLGRRFHFMEPVQLDPEGGMELYQPAACEKGFQLNILTLPEYIRAVLDEFEIGYYKPGLEAAILDTNSYLSQLKQ